MEQKRKMRICSNSICLTWHSLAHCRADTACGPNALLDAICDHTAKPTHAGLANPFCMLLIQFDLGLACVHLVQWLAIDVALMHHSDYSRLVQALQQTKL